MSQDATPKPAPQVARGLEGIVAAETRIADIDGQRGRLTLMGHDIRELAGRVLFGEAAFLLWHGHLPKQQEYDGLNEDIRNGRTLSPPVLEALELLAEHETGMHMLRMASAMLSIDQPDIDSLEIDAAQHQAAQLLAQIPAIVAHTWRMRQGQPIVQPKPHQALVESFLYMLFGEEPDPAKVEALNAYLVAVCEHGLNASTFTARCVISTNSDMVSGLTAAVGALKGPRHGGVPGPVLKMLEEIGSPENAEAYVRRELEQGRYIMGFGHRVYKARDPRAAILADAAEKYVAATGKDRDLLDLVKAVEETTVRVLEEVKPGRNLYANVELYAAIVLHLVGIPPELFTPVFAIGRTAGWTAHMIEQMKEGRIIRPTSVYIGEHDSLWRPMDQR